MWYNRGMEMIANGIQLASVLAYNVRRKRRLMRLTQCQLAERAGITQRVISAVESGERWPRPETLAAIASALETTPATLLTEGAFGPVDQNKIHTS